MDYLRGWVEAWMLRDFEATGAVQYHRTVHIYQVRDTLDCRMSTQSPTYHQGSPAPQKQHNSKSTGVCFNFWEKKLKILGASIVTDRRVQPNLGGLRLAFGPTWRMYAVINNDVDIKEDF